MRAAVGGVVHTDHDLSRKHVLNSKIPLVDLCIASGSSVQVARVPEAPLRQFPIGSPLRRGEASRKWAGAGGLGGRRSETRVLGREIVLCEEDTGGFIKPVAGRLGASWRVSSAGPFPRAPPART